MRLFNFNKKKDDRENISKSRLFLSISKYNEYIIHFMNMQQQGDYAPISAYEKSNGEIVGFLYLMRDEECYALSAQEVIYRMECDFEQKLANCQINSYVILYHSQFANDNNHQLANKDEELKVITVSYNFKNGQKGKIGLTYSLKENRIIYQGFSNFNKEENITIFNTQLKENFDYFQDKKVITAPIYENEIGLQISKSNTKNLSNTWCGIFGFESFREPKGGELLIDYFTLALTKNPIYFNQNIKISILDYMDVVFKTISSDDDLSTIFPVIKTDYIVDVEHKKIDEWENVNGVEAIIEGNGRNTFGVAYFATDYAENKQKYLTKKELNIKISGIAFVLDIHKQKNDSKIFSDDYTGYMPNKDFSNYACFDFIGELEDYHETVLLEDKSLKGYILKVRLITNPEIKDFFTIDIFVTPENMRFKELTKGMKLTGMFQMQGQIAE